MENNTQPYLFFSGTFLIRLIFSVLLFEILSGCATVRYGGAPEPSFNVEKDLEQLESQFLPADSITEFYKNPTKENRNRFISGRLTLMNIRYIQFIRKLSSERQLVDSATEMLVLGLNIAGASFSDAVTKTVLAGLAAGTTGSKQIIDKNYYFEKTVPALVGQMNAERKKALVPILTGVRSTLEEYPFAQAVTALYNYYNAGTFSGAIQAIQAEAGAKERNQDNIIATLQPVSRENVIQKQALTQAIGNLNESDLDKVKKALRSLDPSVKLADNIAAAKEQLQGYVRGARTPARIAEVAKAFKDAGIPINE